MFCIPIVCTGHPRGQGRHDIRTGHPPPPKESDGQGCPSGLHHVSQRWYEQIGSPDLYQDIYIPVNKGARKKIQIGVKPPESERERQLGNLNFSYSLTKYFLFPDKSLFASVTTSVEARARDGHSH